MGIRQVVLAVTRMEAVGFDAKAFQAIEQAFAELAAPLVAVGSRVRSASLSADRVVVTLDGWPAAERAIPPAAEWAKRLGVRLTLVTSADPLLVSQEDGSRHGDHYGPSHDPQTYLSDLARRPELAAVPTDVQVLWSSAAPHVSVGAHLDSHPASLVVATSHIRRRLARLALGSKADIARRIWDIIA